MAKKYHERPVIYFKNITFKRPGFGLSPMRINEVLGRKAKRNFKQINL